MYPTGGLAYQEKGPASATKYFSGNGIAVAVMCAVLHQYRPVAANEGGQWTGVLAVSRVNCLAAARRHSGAKRR